MSNTELFALLCFFIFCIFWMMSWDKYEEIPFFFKMIGAFILTLVLVLGYVCFSFVVDFIRGYL